MTYVVRSERLGFRRWQEAEVEPMRASNADAAVMEYFPSPQDQAETLAFIKRMQLQFDEKGFCYYAVDSLVDGAFIGFIGLSEKTFIADFTPCVDIGWRLAKNAWNQGFATEGRSEEHTSELQSLMRISYDVFCLKTKKQQPQPIRQ